MFFNNEQRQEQNANSEKMQMSNEEFTMPSALHYRLDTQRIIKDLECFLKGQLITYGPDENGNTQAYITQIGDALVNQNGVQAILTYLNSMLNSAVVQGNWGMTWYKYKIASIRRSLTLTMSLNFYHWEVKESNFMFIIDTILDMLTGFLSRLIDNEERKALMPSVKTIETSNMRG